MCTPTSHNRSTRASRSNQQTHPTVSATNMYIPVNPNTIPVPTLLLPTILLDESPKYTLGRPLIPTPKNTIMIQLMIRLIKLYSILIFRLWFRLRTQPNILLPEPPRKPAEHVHDAVIEFGVGVGTGGVECYVFDGTATTGNGGAGLVATP